MRHVLEPLFDFIVVREVEPPEMRQSGLVVPIDRARDSRPPQEGIVIAAGPGLDWWESAGVEMPVKPGDHVVFPWSAGSYVEVDEEKLLLLRVGQLFGKLTEAATTTAWPPQFGPSSRASEQ